MRFFLGWLVLVLTMSHGPARSAEASRGVTSADATTSSAAERCQKFKRGASRWRACCRRGTSQARRRRACLRYRAPEVRRPPAVALAPRQPTAPTQEAPSEAPTGVSPTALGRFLGIDAREFSFTLSRPVVASGTVTFELRNRGEDPHNLVVSPEGTHDRLAAFDDVEAETGRAQKRFDLPPGRYYLWCSLEFHEAAGMNATLRVE